jgi:1-acyl-sn-glycerol-3-phosphate acyltransferase
MLKIFRISLFPILVLVASILVLPACIFRPFNYKNTELFHKIIARIGPFLLGLKITIENKEILNETKPAITVSNHQHSYDLIIASLVQDYRTVTLGKSELKFIPLFGTVFWLAGNILINRGNRDKAKKTMSELNEYIKKNKLSINIFPEGTRNNSDVLLPFKKGAFYTAIETQVPIVINVVNRYTSKIDLSKWQSVDIRVKVLQPVSTIGLTHADVDALMQNVREIMETEINLLS